jgi:hypothetical protein
MRSKGEEDAIFLQFPLACQISTDKRPYSHKCGHTFSGCVRIVG